MVVTNTCAGAPSPLAGVARVITSPTAYPEPPATTATAVAEKNWSLETLNFTGGPFQNEGTPPVTAVVIGTPPPKPVANCGMIHRARMQSAGYWYSYAQGGIGIPLFQIRPEAEGFSGVPGAEVM